MRDTHSHVWMVCEGGGAARGHAQGIQPTVGAVHAARQLQRHRGCAVKHAAVQRAFWRGESVRTPLVSGEYEAYMVAWLELVAATEAHLVRDTREQPDLVVRLGHAFKQHLDVRRRRWRQRWRRWR